MNEILRAQLLDGIVVHLDSPDGHLGSALSALGAELADPSPGTDALVVDRAAWSAAPGVDGLLELLDHVWELTVAAANQSFIAGGRGGRIVFIAPAQSVPAAAALENLCRTLSVEWARHAVTAVTLAPGPTTSPDDLATVVAYLLSPAGAYVTGTRFDLDQLSR